MIGRNVLNTGLWKTATAGVRLSLVSLALKKATCASNEVNCLSLSTRARGFGGKGNEKMENVEGFQNYMSSNWLPKVRAKKCPLSFAWLLWFLSYISFAEHRMLKMEQEEEVRRRLREEEEELKKLEEQIQREQQRRAEERKKMKEREQKVRERQRLLYAKRPSVLLELSSRENKEPILQRQGSQESSTRPQKNGGVSRMFWKWKRRSFSFKSDEEKVTVKRSISEAEDIRMPGESSHKSSEDHKARPRGYSFCEGQNNQRECEELRRYLEREELRERERKEKRSSFRRLWRGERCPPQTNLDTIVRQERCLSKHTSYDSAQTCKQRANKRTSKGDWWKKKKTESV